MTQLQSLEDVFETELKDLYSAEQQLVDALPSMAQAASSKELATAIEQHLEQTRGHVQRIEQVFESCDMPAESEHCKGMEGLIKEGSDIAQADGDDAARDAALIGAAQKVEHYEIASYGTVRALAEQLGHDDAARLLGQTLDEESAANEKLTQIAINSVNVSAR